MTAEPLTSRAFAGALITELVAAVDAVSGGATALPAAESLPGRGWRIDATASGRLRGGVTAWIDDAGAVALARCVLGLADHPDAATIADLFGEMWVQATGALSLKPPFTGVRLALGAAEPGDAPSDAVWVELHAGDAVAWIAVGATAVPAPVEAASPVENLTTMASAPVVAATASLDAVLDIELPLVVRFARTVMPLKTLLTIGPGSVIDMERSPDEPVQLLVGDRLIARGEVVVVGGNYGVRVTELVSPTQHVRVLEA